MSIMIRLIFIFAILLGFFIQTAFAQVWEQAEGEKQPVDLQVMNFKISDFENRPFLKEFTNIVVINKANSGLDRQTLRVFQNGKLVLITKVSTGREEYEKGCSPGQDPKKDHCSVRAYWSTTPVGYFDVDKLVENYFSNLWKTWMPFAVFFESGIATHQAPAGTEGRLGNRASGGCVRMHPNQAPVLYKMVADAGKGLVPVIKRNGEIAKTPAGDIVRKIGYKTLYIVQTAPVE